MSLASLFSGRTVRSDVGMTGEITLRGEVLPIGGLKEKLLAAHRGGITTVLIPDDNKKDLAEIPKNIKDKLTIVPVKWIDEVLEHALVHIDLRRRDFSTDDPDRSEGPTRTRENTTDILIPGVGAVYSFNSRFELLGGVSKGFNPPAPGSSADEE